MSAAAAWSVVEWVPVDGLAACLPGESGHHLAHISLNPWGIEATPGRKAADQRLLHQVLASGAIPGEHEPEASQLPSARRHKRRSLILGAHHELSLNAQSRRLYILIVILAASGSLGDRNFSRPLVANAIRRC